jgi:PQQ-dependent dehydrogenase (methanol/ethanol family)
MKWHYGFACSIAGGMALALAPLSAHAQGGGYSGQQMQQQSQMQQQGGYGQQAQGSTDATQELIQLINDPSSWPMTGGNYAGWRYSPLDQINRNNVRNMHIAWQFSTGQLRGHEGAPLVIGNIMYIQTPHPNVVYALDLNNPGSILWKYNAESSPEAIPVACCDLVNRGPAYANGRIFMTTLDNHVIALDAKTGKEIWKVSNGDYKKGETLTMSPLVVHDKLIVGNSGGEYGVRGNLTAYSLNDGHMIWRAWSTGPDQDVKIDPQKTLMMGKPIGQKDLGVTTWPKNQWKIGGGAPWGWVTYDPELNLIYYGTSNPGTWNPNERPGDNKWAASIFARNPDTGEAAWVYQYTPHDEWDFDGVNENILNNINVKGQPHKVLVHFYRNGFAYTIDRTNGVLLVAEKYDPTVNWATSVNLQTGLPQRVQRYSTSQGTGKNVQGICPAALGAKDQQPAAYSPRTNLFYVPGNHLCMDYQPIDISYVAGQPYVGAIVNMYGANHGNQLGRFIAWDASTGKTRWEIPERWAVWSGALSTGGDIVFYGTMDGWAKAVDAGTGEVLWKQKLPSGIVGYFSTFEHNGKQYVSVLSGIGGWAALGLAAGLHEPTAGLGVVGAFADLAKYTALGGTLTVFEVPGNVQTASATGPQQQQQAQQQQQQQ